MRSKVRKKNVEIRLILAVTRVGHLPRLTSSPRGPQSHFRAPQVTRFTSLFLTPSRKSNQGLRSSLPRRTLDCTWAVKAVIPPIV